MDTRTDAAAVVPGRASFGPFVLDAGQARLLRDGQALPLTGRPFDLLAALVAQPGRLLTKDDLLDAVWGHRHVSDSALKVAVNALRDALGDDVRSPRYVETVPRRGYRFIATVERAAEAPEVPSGNLPPAPEPLIGRAEELLQVLELLAAHRLVTITGLGGVGKTRLALAAAASAPADAPRWLLRLDELEDESLLVPTLAQTLHLGSKAAADAGALARSLADRRVLLVLDNAEHLVGGVARLVSALLAATTAVRVLATSQIPLRLQAEQVFALGPLGLSADIADSEPAPSDYPAAQLFCARVRQRMAGWQPAAHDAADIAAICRSLDGVPLALELAAARVPLLGLNGVRERLDQRFSLLTGGARDGAARHRTLAAALNWTLGLLTPRALGALQQLAVLTSSFTVADGESLLGEGGLDDIDELLARSLLAPQVEGRLHLYDSVRRHALEAAMASGREPALRLRHLQWMEARLQRLHETDLFVPLQRWLPPWRHEIDSLRSALRFGLSPSPSEEVRTSGLRVAAASMVFWHRVGLRSEGWSWLAQAQALARAHPPDDETAARLDHAHATFVVHAQLGSPADGLAALRRARTVWERQGDRVRLAISHAQEYQLLMRVDPSAAGSAQVAALEAVSDDHWPRFSRRHVLLMRSVEARRRGDPQESLAQADAYAALCREAHAQIERWTAVNLSAQALVMLGRLDEAGARFGEVAGEIVRLGLQREHWQLLALSASIDLRRGLTPAREAAALETIRLLAPDGLVWWMADALPWVALHGGRAADAARLQQWADALAAARGDTRGPVFGRLRDDLLDLLGRPATGEPPIASEQQALDLAFGPGRVRLDPTSTAVPR